MDSVHNILIAHFFRKKFQHICVSLDVNFNELLTNNVISFEQLGPDFQESSWSKPILVWRPSKGELANSADPDYMSHSLTCLKLIFDSSSIQGGGVY